MKKFNNIIIISLILNILLCIYLVFFLKPVKTYTLEDYMAENYSGVYPNEIDNTATDATIYFSNIDELVDNYQGELGIFNLTKKISSLMETGFKTLYTETIGMTNTQLSNYFTEHQRDIRLNTGITDTQSFAKLINKLQIYKNGTMQYESSKLVEGTVASDGKYTTFDLQINYTDNSILNFKVYFSNKDNIDTPIVILEP